MNPPAIAGSPEMVKAIKNMVKGLNKHESFFPIRPFSTVPLVTTPLLGREHLLLLQTEVRSHAPQRVDVKRHRDVEELWGAHTQMYPGHPPDMPDEWVAGRRVPASALSSSGFVLMDRTVDEMAEENTTLRERLREVRLALGARSEDKEDELVRELRKQIKAAEGRIKSLEGALSEKRDREADAEIWDGPVVVR